ncbi:hypothetical protein GCM10020000_09680 [Streptomyces olivoverticillatus]
MQLQGDEVTVDLAPVIDKVKGRLTDAGLDAAARIPQVHTGFVIYSSPDLAKYKTWFRLLGIAGDWLPLIVAVIAAIGVFVAANRRRALIGAALGILAAMVVLGVAIAVFRSFYLDHLPPDVSHGAAGAVYDALVHFLRQAVRAVGVLAAAVAIGAFVIGPSHPAVTLRDACSGGIAGTRRAADSAGFRAGLSRAVHTAVQALDRCGHPRGRRRGVCVLGAPDRHGRLLVRGGRPGGVRHPRVPRPPHRRGRGIRVAQCRSMTGRRGRRFPHPVRGHRPAGWTTLDRKRHEAAERLGSGQVGALWNRLTAIDFFGNSFQLAALAILCFFPPCSS